MAWILLATFGQFLNAVVAIMDKYIVTDERALPRASVYAFYSCLLTGFWVVIYFVGLLPGMAAIGIPQFSNIERPTIQVVGMSFLSGYTLFIALVSMYDALKRAEAVNVMPVIGAISAISSFGLTYWLLDMTLTINFMMGILVLVLGTLLVAQTLPHHDTVLQVTHSGIFFALHYITMKGLFEETSFDDGFFWSRVGLVLVVLSLLLVPSFLEKVTNQTKLTSRRTGGLVLLAKALAGVAAFLMLKATDWGNVAVVQALDGLKFVMILFITFLLGAVLPNSAAVHDTRPQVVLRQVLYVALIVVGYLILFINW
jgi:drug/metabolite transporter (DMT)-like permease